MSVLADIASGKHEFSKRWLAAKKPMLILGSTAMQRDDADAILTLAQSVASKSQV